MRAREFTQKLFESKLSYIGNCTDDDVIEHLFGDATGFAQAVDEYGDDFELDDLVVKYDPDSDIHSFYYKQQGVTESDGHPKSFTNNGLTWTLEHLGSIDGKDLGAGGLIDIFKGYQDINNKGKFRWFIRGQRTGVLRPVSSEHTAIRKFLHPNVANNDEYKKFTEQGVTEDNVDEMALSTYKTMGDFSKPGPFTGADKKLVPHPKNIEKATRFFEQTPFDFRLFFSHLKGTGKYSEHGPMTPDELRKVFGQDAEEIINGSEDAITVVYVGNKGDSKVMLTPWMMAHRFGHAINAGARNKNWTAWGEAEKYFFGTINDLLKEYYSKEDKNPSPYSRRPKSEQMSGNLTLEYNVLFNTIGTQRSSSSGQIRRPYEFMYELLAQYIGTGKITLNPFPENLKYKLVYGNPTMFMNIKPEYRDEGERKQAADSLAYTMELLFNDVLGDSVGKIFVM